MLDGVGEEEVLFMPSSTLLPPAGQSARAEMEQSQGKKGWQTGQRGRERAALRQQQGEKE